MIDLSSVFMVASVHPVCEGKRYELTESVSPFNSWSHSSFTLFLSKLTISSAHVIDVTFAVKLTATQSLKAGYSLIRVVVDHCNLHPLAIVTPSVSFKVQINQYNSPVLLASQIFGFFEKATLSYCNITEWYLSNPSDTPKISSGVAFARFN